MAKRMTRRRLVDSRSAHGTLDVPLHGIAQDVMSTPRTDMDDPAHQGCYWFFRNLHDADAATWVVPGLIFFEMQAMRARRYREKIDGLPVYGNLPLYIENTELFEVTQP